MRTPREAAARTPIARRAGRTIGHEYFVRTSAARSTAAAARRPKESRSPRRANARRTARKRSAAGRSVVTRCPCARSDGDKDATASARSPASAPNRPRAAARTRSRSARSRATTMRRPSMSSGSRGFPSRTSRPTATNSPVLKASRFGSGSTTGRKADGSAAQSRARGGWSGARRRSPVFSWTMPAGRWMTSSKVALSARTAVTARSVARTRKPAAASRSARALRRAGPSAGDIPRSVERHPRAESRQPRDDRLEELGEARSRGRRDPDGSGVYRARVRAVGLVVREEDAPLLDAEARDHLLGDGPLLRGLRGRRVHDVDEKVRVLHLGERGLERRHERVRELAEEADGVGEHDRAPAHAVEPRVPRVERREEAVLGELLRGGEAVEERRFPRVRVADERNRRDPLEPFPPHIALRLDRLELFLEPRDARPHAPTVQLDLPLARAAPERAAAALLGQSVGGPREARKLVLEPRELDLRHGFPRARAGREDAQDDARAVEHLRRQLLVEIPRLRGRELVVEDRPADVLGARASS